MGRISQKFLKLKKENKKAFIVYLTAGDPSLKQNEALVCEFEKSGVDLIELGVPFSDPLADGPVIQEASNRSLERGTTLAKILKLVESIRQKSQIPILLMSYLNPILSFGLQAFAKQAHKVGVDGLIIPDLPPDEGAEVSKIMRKNSLDLVYLLAPTSPLERVKKVTHASRGFVYYVSMTGVTGSTQKSYYPLKEKIQEAKKYTSLPICMGFGISTPAQAKKMAAISDGVIVGSAIVKAAAQHPKMSAKEFSNKFIAPFSKALGKNPR